MLFIYLNSLIELYVLKRAGQVAHRVSLTRSVAVSMNKAGRFSFCYVEYTSYTSYTSETHIYNAHARCILLLILDSENRQQAVRLECDVRSHFSWSLP